MTGAQCQAARLRLGWSTRQLAAKAGVPWSEIIRFDYGTGEVAPEVVAAVQMAFRRAGLDLRQLQR
ncbi:XRE family transcriptional regulator [Azospirillum thermophilum]|uniref:XRE family transcriptional regulator n=1 Tax=Azospirillum thermophilum TaxID=2202148 RepID=A0A2S2CRT0_9PROT|nr:XRE family transcriptional regulator [Azospirillum thermophilum]AWK87214.1 XRE family transcriptional regulator [Azospirillum thermophilum]